MADYPVLDGSGNPIITAANSGQRPFQRPKIGWIDYNDAATASSPISLAVAGTYYKLTNDGLGPFSNDEFAPFEVPGFWDVSANQFDFSSLNLGDTLDIRVDVTITTGSPNTEVRLRYSMAVGGSPYPLNFFRRNYKTAATYESEIRFTHVYMGDLNTRDNPAEIEAAADGTGSTIVVNGWAVRLLGAY